MRIDLEVENQNERLGVANPGRKNLGGVLFGGDPDRSVAGESDEIPLGVSVVIRKVALGDHHGAQVFGRGTEGAWLRNSPKESDLQPREGFGRRRPTPRQRPE